MAGLGGELERRLTIVEIRRRVEGHLAQATDRLRRDRAPLGPLASIWASMGQPITVTQSPATRHGVVRFELNRSLTGMGHERYRVGDDVSGVRPPDELARRLLATGDVEGVHVFSNVVTVDLAKGSNGDGLLGIVEDLFLHYTPGVLPPTDEELLGQAPTG